MENTLFTVSYWFSFAGFRTALLSVEVVVVSIAASISKFFASFMILVKVKSWATCSAGSCIWLTAAIPTGIKTLLLCFIVVSISSTSPIDKLFANMFLFVKVISLNVSSAGSCYCLTCAITTGCQTRPPSIEAVVVSSPLWCLWWWILCADFVLAKVIFFGSVADSNFWLFFATRIYRWGNHN